MPASLPHPTPNRRFVAKNVSTNSSLRSANTRPTSHRLAMIDVDDPDRPVIVVLLVGLLCILVGVTCALAYTLFVQ
jgi:hypothetical protein